MSSLQSLRELISERLAAAAEEIYRLCEGTIVQYEQELCRQRRLLDVIWKPKLQLHNIVLPQHWMTEEADQCNQQRNFRVEQEEPEPPQIQEEQEEPEPPQIKEEQEETEPPQIQEELQSFNVTDSQDEEENQNEESTSTTDEETDPQNRDQRKRRDRSHVQSVDSSHMSAVLPQCWMIEEEDLCIQQRNFRVEHEELERLHTKEEPGELCISQDEDQIDLKQETDTLMEIPTYEEDENSEADLNNQQSFNVTDSQDEEGNQHEESTSTTDEETDPQNRDQRKRRDRSHVQSVDSSHMSAVLPQYWMTEEEDLRNQQRNFRVEQEEPEPPQIQEELEEPEPPQMKEEQEELFISQDEEGNQHEESTSTTDEETDPQNRDQRKRRDRRHVQSVDSSHMSAGQCDSDLHLHTIALPQCLMIEEEDLCIQQRNFRVEQEEPERPQTKEEKEEQEPPQIEEEMQVPEPPQMKEEPGEFCISQDEDRLVLKQETDTLMELPSYKEDENSEADRNNQQSFNVTDSQDEEGNHHEKTTSSTDEETESTSTTDEETDPQNGDQRKRRDGSHVQSVDSSHISESQCETDVRKNPKKTNLAGFFFPDCFKEWTESLWINTESMLVLWPHLKSRSPVSLDSLLRTRVVNLHLSFSTCK
ncbi:uncharacterized protein LOC144986836 isoform X3 [Oryzias latipes]